VQIEAVRPRVTATVRGRLVPPREVVVRETGTVTDAKVVRSIPMLDDATPRAARQWKFDPTIVSGQSLPVRMTVTVNFTLPRR
jgi:TonB family protein